MATTIATSTFAQPLVRAGSRAVIKLSGGNLLAIYHDGTAFKSKEASSEANLASATAVSIVASTGTGDANSYCLWPDGVFLSVVNSTSGATSYQTYATGAWTAHAAPGTFGNYSQVSGFKSGTSYYFESWGNFNAEFDGHYATSFGGAFTSLGQNDFVNTDGLDGQGLVALPWNGFILTLGLDSGKNLQWYAKDTLAGANGGNFNTATSIEILGASAVYQNNLAGVTDSNGNAWMAYNDSTGIQLRMLTATGSAWTAKTSVTTQASDKSPAMFQDTAGGVWVVWIDGGTANAIKAQKATVSAGAISLSGTVQTIVATTATRNYLSCIESDAANIHMVWTEGTASPYNVVFHSYALSSTTTSNRTITPTTANLLSTFTRTLTPATGAVGNYVTRTIGTVTGALQGTAARTIGTVTGAIQPNINPVAITTADMQSQTRFGRPIVRDQSGVAVIPITPTWSDATQFGPAASIYSAPSPYSAWTKQNSPGSGLNGIRLGEQDASSQGVVNPSIYFDSTNNNLFMFGPNNQNDGLATHNYNDCVYGYTTAYNGTWTTSNQTATWDDCPFDSAVIIPSTHNIWYVAGNITPGTAWKATATAQNIQITATTGETTATWTNTGSGGSGNTASGPVAPANSPAVLAPQITYTAGSPATLYCFFNDTAGVLRYCTWNDAATPALPSLGTATTGFASPISTGTLGITDEQFSVTRDSADGLHVAVKNSSGIQYTYKPLGGAWTAATTISSAANDTYPRVTCFGSSNVAVTWSQATGTANKQNIVYATSVISTTPSFSAAKTIYADAGTNNASYPNVEANSQDGTSYMVVWVQGTASPYTTYAAQVAPTFVNTANRTITPTSAALQSTLGRTATATAALQSTLGRTFSASANLSAATIAMTDYGSAAAATTVTTAGKLFTGTGGTLGTVTTSVKTTTQYVEIFAKGTATTQTGVASQPAPTGNGWLLDATTLEGKTTITGNWSVTASLLGSVTGITVTPVFRAYKRSSGGTYTLIGSITGSSVAVGTTATALTFTATSFNAISFYTGDKLYFDLFANITANTTTAGQSATLGISEATSASASGVTNYAVTTPGYATTSIVTSTRTISSATASLANTLSRTTTATTALQGTLSRTVTTTAALLSTLSRTVTATGALQSTLSRTTTATGALQSTLSHTFSATTALQSTLSRTAAATSALSGTVARTISATGALQSTLSRQAAATGALQSTLSRQATATTALSGTFSRTATATTALSGTVARTLTPTTAALSGTFARTISATTANLSGSGTFARTITPATGALQGTFARTVMGASVALQSTLSRTITGASTPLLSTLSRSLTPATVVLSGTFKRTITAASANLSGTGINRTITPSTAALQSLGLGRTVTPTAAALQSTLARTMLGNSGALQSTLARTLSTVTVALLGSPTRTVTATVALSGALARAVPATAVLSTLAQARTISGVSGALQSTLGRSLTPTSVTLQATLARTLATVSAALTGILSRTVPATAALAGSGQRTVPVSAALSGGSARAFGATAALSGTLSRTAPTSAALQSTLGRVVVASASLKQFNLAHTIAAVTATVTPAVPPTQVASKTAVFAAPASLVVLFQTRLP